jgi:hypothetical protein
MLRLKLNSSTSKDAPGPASPLETTLAVAASSSEPAAAQPVTPPPPPQASMTSIAKREWLRDLTAAIEDQEQTLGQQLKGVEQQEEALREKGATVQRFYDAQKAFRDAVLAVVDG